MPKNNKMVKRIARQAFQEANAVPDNLVEAAYSDWVQNDYEKLTRIILALASEREALVGEKLRQSFHFANQEFGYLDDESLDELIDAALAKVEARK
jgi:hypothetical protein